ncbi:MAG: hypothetical protein EBU79_13430, partial [Betaproteobacteria bacterium]|nr:hypothetical protein [Betaproteobacteria bacterium]
MLRSLCCPGHSGLQNAYTEGSLLFVVDPFAGSLAMSKHAPLPTVSTEHRRLALASIALVALGLSGCVGVAVTGAAVGAVASGDRRS